MYKTNRLIIVVSPMNGDSGKKHPQSMVSIQDSSAPSGKKATKVTIDGVFAKIVVFEKEDLTNEEICRLLNIASFTKLDIDKHYERENGVDIHFYTVYNVLI